MSKKKAFSGSTMTLKDFHGGSIPSDIPLPSAPGVIVRPADRPGYDRQTSWSNRSEHRLRPSSSGSMRNLDDKTPFLTTNTTNIGRNFDEDERKPLDGALGPRRTVSDESFRAPLARSEPKGEVGGRFAGQQGSSSTVSQASANSYSARVVEGGHVGGSSGPLSGNGGGGSYPNAWGVRKEVVAETGSSPWAGQNTVSKFAQASALDQISSGRWQTKPMAQQADVEVIRHAESPNSFYGRESHTYGGVNSGSERDYYEASLVRHVDRGLAVNGFESPNSFHGGIKEVPDIERVHSPVPLDGKERNSVLYINEGQPAYPDGKYGGSELQLLQEVSERPRLKLLPRTKPLDAMEPSGVDHKQVQQPIISSRSESGGNIHGNAINVKPGLGCSEASPLKPQLNSEAANRLVERPKLNLKPRSQPLDQSVGSTEKKRMGPFGGARPREMVLKERGVDDVNNHEEVQSPIRTKSDVQHTEVTTVHANTSRLSERAENLPTDQRVGRGHEKREPRSPAPKADTQKKNWRNENWRNSREPEKHQQQERAPSPQTWRKPIEVEEPKPANSDASGMRFGKAVSAAELVQAFSRSVPDPKPVEQFSGQRGLPGRSQIPFSRLTGSATRPQINGY